MTCRLDFIGGRHVDTGTAADDERDVAWKLARMARLWAAALMPLDP